MNIMVAVDFVCACFMLIPLIGLICERSKRKSTFALIETFIVNILCLVAEAVSYMVYGKKLSRAFYYLIFSVVYSFGTLSLLMFMKYWYYYITEKTFLNKFYVKIPGVFVILTFVYVFVLGCTGRIVKVENSLPVIAGRLPACVSFIQLFMLVYLPIIAGIKYRSIGLKNVLVLGTFGIFPFIANLLAVVKNTKDLTYAAASVSLMIIYVLVQNYRSIERDEEKKKQISKKNKQLRLIQGERKEQYEAIESIAEIFYSLHLIDLRKDSVKEINAQNQVKEISKEKIGAADMMFKIMSNVTSGETRQAVLHFTDLKTLADRIGNRKVMTGEFQGNNIGWFVAMFIVMERDEKGKAVKVIFSTRVIDEEKREKETLIQKTQTDEMTGLYNRRAYEENIYEDNDIPKEKDFVYISMDVNGLKIINDSIGHVAGDELIIGSCECMKKAFGEYGRIYRIGGDEFVAILYATEEKLKELLKDFDSIIENWKGKLIDSVSVSYGYVLKSEFENASVRELAATAEKRMYEAKSAYYRRKGVDRRGQQDAHKALCELYTKILKINITEDSYQIVNMQEEEKDGAMGFNSKISKWLYDYGISGQVHKEDLEQYLARTDMSFMQEYFKSNKTSLSIFYRRKYNQGYKQVMMEIIPANDYAHDNQSLFLYVKSIDK